MAATLSSYIDHYLHQQRKLGRLNQDSARKTGYRLTRFSNSFGRRPLNQLNQKAVERWLADLDHLSPGTRRLNLSTVGTFCRWMVREGHISSDPTAGLYIAKPRSVPRALTLDQVTTFLDALPDERALVMVVLMLHCGLRCVEVSRARVEDYNPRNRTILVIGKGGHERVLPVPVPAAEVLDGYLSHRTIVAGPLIRSRNEPWKPLTPNTISTMLSKAMKAAGIKRSRFDGVAAHALRHTAASDTLDQSGDLEAVREMLGHVSLTTTQIYLRRANLDRLRTAMEGRNYVVRPLDAVAPLRGVAGAGVASPATGNPTEEHRPYPATA